MLRIIHSFLEFLRDREGSIPTVERAAMFTRTFLIAALIQEREFLT